MLKFLILAAVAASLTTARAEDVKPLSAQRVSLGTMEGVAYFSEEPNNFRVVATFAEGDSGTPLRVIATLTDGQSIQFSVPHGANEPEEVAELFRNGNVLVLRNPLEPLTASVE